MLFQVHFGSPFYPVLSGVYLEKGPIYPVHYAVYFGIYIGSLFYPVLLRGGGGFRSGNFEN